MSRRRQRSPDSIKVFGVDFTVVRLIDRNHAQRLIDQNKATEVMSVDGAKFLGIKMALSPRLSKALKDSEIRAAMRRAQLGIAEPDARRSCVVLSKAEAEAVAERRQSRTMGLPADSCIREQRVKAGLPECDFAEAARTKFHAMFPALVSA